MPRTPLLRAFRKLFQDAHFARRSGISMSDIPELRVAATSRRGDEPEPSQASGLSRRRVLSVAGAGIGAGALAYGAPRVARAKGQPTIAIVGAGIAGVSAALKLADHG